MSSERIEDFRKILVYKKYKANDTLLEINTVPNNIHFLLSGIARTYIITPKGTEYNRTLYSNSDVLGSLEALIHKKKSIYGMQCLTDCDIIECKYKDVLSISEKHIEISILHRKILESFYIHYSKINTDKVTLNATQRYYELLNSIPNINNLISQKHISSFLGITAIQFSRLKKDFVYNRNN